MRFTHRALAALLALILCLFGGATLSPLFAVPAVAEEAPELSIEVAASPDQRIEPGDVALSFTLTNHTDGLLESVSLTSTDGLLVEPIGDMAAGTTLTYTRVHAMTQEELDAGRIEYIITCVSGSDHFSYTVEAAVEKAYPEPEVEFLRQVSSLYASDGGSVTVTYRLRNVGNVTVTGVTVADPLGGFSSRLESLAVGASRAFVQHVSLAEAAVSSPILSYTTESSGGDVYTVSLDPLTIEPARGMLDATLTAGRSMFASDTAEVILQLVNSGNVDYLDVTVYDDVYGGVIADSISVPAGGEPVEVAHTYPIRGDSSYRWRVTGRTSAGDRFDMITDTERVFLDSEGGDPLLTVSVTTSMPKISRRGYVPLHIELTNIGEATASAVRILDQSGSELFELAVVPTGEPTVRELRYEIRETTTLTVSAVYTDSYGRERIATAEPLTIAIGAGGQAPETKDGQTATIFSGLATQMSHSGLFTVLLIGSCVVLVVLIVVLIVTSRRARIQRKARKQRLKEELGKTNSFKPLRTRRPARSRDKKDKK